ncbi:MAG: MnhB domain-containing protein [Collinsella sp.]|nr:MnhB domain-containing protein [Collinsella sp.]
MTEQEYAKAAENIGRALSLLTSKIGTLSKPPLKVPPINAGSDDAEKRKALRDMLESLASTDDAAVLSQEDIRRASSFFAKLYGGSEPYRHRYADICDLVFNALGQSSGDLDEGVPYSVNCLAENIRIIHEYLTKHGLCDQAKSVLKLADHIDLEKTRLSHDIEQQQAMRAFKTAIAEVEAERDEADQKRAELEREFDERLDKTRMEYIAILGVFAAVVLAFNGGVGFSTSAMGALGIDGGIRAIVLLAALVGFVLINTVCILLVFIWKMSFNHRKVELGNWPRNCLIAADVALVFIMAAMMALSHPGLREFIGL